MDLSFLTRRRCWTDSPPRVIYIETFEPDESMLQLNLEMIQNVQNLNKVTAEA